MEGTLRLNGSTVDLVRGVVHRDGQTAPLTAKETDLLRYLAGKAGADVSREELLEEVWGYRADMLTRTVDNTVRRLRSKVEIDARNPEHVITVFGVGYRFEAFREAVARRAAPTGDVCLLVVRVEGRRGAAERLGESLRGAIASIDRLVDEIADAGLAYVAERDPWRLGFSDAEGAVAAALGLQEALLGLDWAADVLADDVGREVRAGDAVLHRGLRVAVAVHGGHVTSATDAATGSLGYVGEVCDLADRVVAIAHGGQVLVTGDVWHGLVPTPPSDARDLGFQRLDGQPRPVRLYQVLPASLALREFPPLVTRSARRRSNLPAESSSFVGRGSDLRKLASLVAAHPLVTLVGAGGTGKTRLARRFGVVVFDRYARGGGVWFCDLASTHTADDVVRVVADVLDVDVDPAASDDPARQVGQAIASRGDALLILDNLEQVTPDAAPVVATWTATAPLARFLVTSRAPLRVGGEQVQLVGPLDDDAALALFVDRARAVQRGFVLGDRDTAAVADIVRRLDRIPLALELAAARVRVLPPTQLAARLGQRFDTLSTRGGGTERHATLRNAIDWSWALLTDTERHALAGLSVFRGGFTLDAAREVIATDDVEAVVGTLRSGSLLHTYEPADQPGTVRLGIYESIRDYAAERLHASDVERGTRRRHAEHFAREAASWVTALDGPDRARALVMLSLEQDNLVEAHRWAIASGAPGSLVVALTRVLDALLGPRGPHELHLAVLDASVGVLDRLDSFGASDVLRMRGHARTVRGLQVDARDDLEGAIRHARQAGDAEREVAAVLDLGLSMRSQGFLGEASRVLEAGLRISRDHGSRAIEGQILGALGRVRGDQGRVAEGVDLVSQALAVHREVGSVRAEAKALVLLGSLHGEEGRPVAALACYRPALKLVRDLADRRLEGAILANLGEALLQEGHWNPALDHLHLALDLHRTVGSRAFEGWVLALVGAVHQDRGDLGAARNHYERARALLQEVGDRRNEGTVLGALGSVRHEEGGFQDALELYRRALHVGQEVGDRRLVGRVVARLGVLLCHLERPGEARRAFARARRELAAAGDEGTQELLPLLEAFVTAAEGEPGAAAAVWRKGAASSDDRRPIASRSAAARWALRVARV